MDFNDNDIEKEEIILNMGPDADDVLGKNAEELKDFDFNLYLTNKGIVEYSIENVYENIFRFATDKEIENFVKKLPKDSINFWFDVFILAHTLIHSDPSK